MNEKFTKTPDEESFIKQLYLNYAKLFEQDVRDKKKQWAKKPLAWESISCHAAGSDLRKLWSTALTLRVGTLWCP